MHRPTFFSLSADRRALPGPSGGFSLVEVVLALLVAATGLLSIFGTIPGSLRQNQLSRSDLVESGFGSTVLQALGGNIRMIDDLEIWNDPREFWKAAAKGTGLPDTLEDDGSNVKSAANVRKRYKEAVPEESGTKETVLPPFSTMTTFVAENYPDDASDADIWFVCAELDKRELLERSEPPDEKIFVPAQYLIRLARIRRQARRITGVRAQSLTEDLDLPFDSLETVRTPDTDSRAGAGASAWMPNVYVISVVSTDRAWPDVFIREPVYSQEFSFVHRP